MAARSDGPKSSPEGERAEASLPLAMPGFEVHRGLWMEGLPIRARDVIVCLPPGYTHSGSERYPALYIQDGQNLFENAPIRRDGDTWKLDTEYAKLLAAGEIRPFIIVALCSTEDRLNEYSPVYDESEKTGGGAAHYCRFLVDGIKPFIDRSYRTDPSAEVTAIAGSSMGALASAYAAFSRPEVFGAAALISPAVWWGEKSILKEIRLRPDGARIWLDVGDAEGHDDSALSQRTLGRARELKDKLLASGWDASGALEYREIAGGRHDEAAWAARIGEIMKFLFPARAA